MGKARPLPEQREYKLLLQAEYLPEGVQTSADIYVKLASLVVDKADLRVTTDNIPGILTMEDMKAATEVAKHYLSGRIGCLAAAADAAEASTEALERLYQTQLGLPT